nr:hypothetical protein Iba_chr14aCG20560 [Ipomoea batatas]GME08021.1 hypothetical protein Iba_scaffold7170CG0330 [Ipomoea batatas]
MGVLKDLDMKQTSMIFLILSRKFFLRYLKMRQKLSQMIFRWTFLSLFLKLLKDAQSICHLMRMFLVVLVMGRVTH